MSRIRVQVAPRVAPDNPRGARAAAALALALGDALERLFARAAWRRRDAAEQSLQRRELAREYQQAAPQLSATLLTAAARNQRRYG
jgi:hypothetical protein